MEGRFLGALRVWPDKTTQLKEVSNCLVSILNKWSHSCHWRSQTRTKSFSKGCNWTLWRNTYSSRTSFFGCRLFLNHFRPPATRHRRFPLSCLLLKGCLCNRWPFEGLCFLLLAASSYTPQATSESTTSFSCWPSQHVFGVVPFAALLQPVVWTCSDRLSLGWQCRSRV